MWRYEWERSQNPDLKQKLVTYNAEDCEALERVANVVAQLCQRQTEAAKSGDDNVVHTDSMKREDPYRFGDVEFAIPEFQYVNQAAYWDYQREKIYVRSSPRLRQASRKAAKRRAKSLPVNEVIECPLPCCPQCKAAKVIKGHKKSKIVRDLKFGRAGIKRRVTKYLSHRYSCRQCGTRFDPPLWPQSMYGPDLTAYMLYQLIELRVPQNPVAQNLNHLCGFNLSRSIVEQQKIRASRLYKGTYEAILHNIVKGGLIHADETKITIEGKDAYAWALTNLEEVAYFYTETREGDTIQALLKDFKGVLVSDFYPAYDSIDCPQQKCLIHLMRDLNEDLLKQPFNEELKELVREFAMLLKPMIETVDRFGLKARHLRKHKVFVERFYKWLSERDYHSEIAIKYKKRFEKYRDKLFTFLDYDDVPWNNNNAEHAIKAFVRLCKVIHGGTSDKGIREYLILLSICETCKYKGVSFLDFLRSGEKDIDEFIAKTSRRRRSQRAAANDGLSPADVLQSEGEVMTDVSDHHTGQ